MLGPGAPLGSGAGDPQSVQLPLFTTCVEPSGHLEKEWDSLPCPLPAGEGTPGQQGTGALCTRFRGASSPGTAHVHRGSRLWAWASVEEVPSTTTFAPQVKRTVSVAQSPSQSIAVGPSSAPPASQTWENH